MTEGLATLDLRETMRLVRFPSWIIDRDGRVVWENEAAIRLFGDMRGRLYASLVAPDYLALAQEQFARKLLGQPVTDYELVCVLPTARTSRSRSAACRSPTAAAVSRSGSSGSRALRTCPAGPPPSPSPLTPRAGRDTAVPRGGLLDAADRRRDGPERRDRAQSRPRASCASSARTRGSRRSRSPQPRPPRLISRVHYGRADLRVRLHGVRVAFRGARPGRGADRLPGLLRDERRAPVLLVRRARRREDAVASAAGRRRLLRRLLRLRPLMAEGDGEQLTRAQHEQLMAELAELEGPKRKAVVEAIATARGHGDLSENFEYHAAKNEQGLLERRITILRSRLQQRAGDRRGGGGRERRRHGRRDRRARARGRREDDGRDLERRRRLARVARRPGACSARPRATRSRSRRRAGRGGHGFSPSAGRRSLRGRERRSGRARRRASGVCGEPSPAARAAGSRRGARRSSSAPAIRTPT